MNAVNGTNGHHAGQLVGRVESVNDRGVRIDGTWRNISKWADDVTMPARGQVVALTLDGSGFVRAIAPAADAPPSRQAGRETTITRLSVLKAAAEFGAARPDLKSCDVLAIAAAWERWVLREDA